MKRNSLTLLLAAGVLLLVAGVQTARAQKVVLHMAGNQTFECSISQLDSITFCFDTPGMNPKVRIGIYETITCYSVRDLNVYADATTDITQTSCVLFADADEETFSIDFGDLNYTTNKELRERLGTNFIGRSVMTASYAGNLADNYFTTCMPNESGTNFNLRVDYTLEATDGSGEVIHVTNASAQVPAKYTKWESGRAYTYLFKIHDNYTGWTAGQSVSELFPISLDAIIVESSDDNTNVTR